MKEKVTWKKIFEDFKDTYPSLVKEVCYWCPREYATIQINLKDGMMLAYNYDTKRAIILCNTWDEH